MRECPSETVRHWDKHAHGFYWTEGTRGLGWVPDAVPTLKVGSSVGIPAPPAILMPDGRVITPDVDGNKRWKVEISTFPVWLKREPLASFLQYDGNPLSARATRGFLARADLSSLRFVEGFKDRVRTHLRRMEGCRMEGSSPDAALTADALAEATLGLRHVI